MTPTITYKLKGAYNWSRPQVFEDSFAGWTPEETLHFAETAEWPERFRDQAPPLAITDGTEEQVIDAEEGGSGGDGDEPPEVDVESPEARVRALRRFSRDDR